MTNQTITHEKYQQIELITTREVKKPKQQSITKQASNNTSDSGETDKESKDNKELKAGTGTIHTTTPNTGE